MVLANRRREPGRATPRPEATPALGWVVTASCCLCLSALLSGWWAAGACLVGLAAVAMLGVLASERAQERPTMDATVSAVRDRRTGAVVVNEEGEPWS